MLRQRLLNAIRCEQAAEWVDARQPSVQFTELRQDLVKAARPEIDTREEFDALPIFTVVRDAVGVVCELQDTSTEQDGSTSDWFAVPDDQLPVPTGSCFAAAAVAGMADPVHARHPKMSADKYIDQLIRTGKPPSGGPTTTRAAVSSTRRPPAMRSCLDEEAPNSKESSARRAGIVQSKMDPRGCGRHSHSLLPNGIGGHGHHRCPSSS